MTSGFLDDIPKGYLDDLPNIDLPSPYKPKETKRKTTQHPAVICEVNCRDALRSLEEGINSKNKLSTARKIADRVLERINIYETGWDSDENNRFPLDLIRRPMTGQALEDLLRSDRRIIELLRNEYSHGLVRDFNRMLEDFELVRNRYYVNHPWPFLRPQALNLHDSKDIEGVCLALLFCHDIMLPAYPILTEQQRKTVDQFPYLYFCISEDLMKSYLIHVKRLFKKVMSIEGGDSEEPQGKAGQGKHDTRVYEVSKLHRLSVSKLIKCGESHILEFKETLEYDVKQDRLNKNLNKECLNTTTPFRLFAKHGSSFFEHYRRSSCAKSESSVVVLRPLPHF